MVNKDHYNLLTDGELSSLIELDAAEYVGSFEHQGRICDYYRATNENDEASFFYVVRADE